MKYLLIILLSGPVHAGPVQRAIHSWCERHLVALDPEPYEQEAAEYTDAELLAQATFLQNNPGHDNSWQELNDRSERRVLLKAIERELKLRGLN